MASELDPRGLALHPWALHAVNIEDPARRMGIHDKPVRERRLLASFIGTHMSHYLSDVRLRLKAIASPEVLVEVRTDKWHFEDVVYGHQVRFEPLDLSYRIDDSVRRYNAVLSDSRFALCPSGAGPNTLRLWEAMAVGAVPVLLGSLPVLPEGGSLPPIDWDAIVIKVPEEAVGTLPEKLASISMEELQRRSALAQQAYRAVREQTCW